MKMLAIDTSTNACSVALDVDGRIIEEHVVEPRAHTRILMPMTKRLLDAAGLQAAELDAVVLGNGPGSFIGMRIGASVAQGICFAAGIDIVPVSSLVAVAAEAMAAAGASKVVVTQDARMNEVYVGVFCRGDDGLPDAVGAEFIAAVDGLDLGSEQFIAAGAGWTRYPALMQRFETQIDSTSNVLMPRARWLLKFAVRGNSTSVSPLALAPAYLRKKVAEKPPVAG